MVGEMVFGVVLGLTAVTQAGTGTTTPAAPIYTLNAELKPISMTVIGPPLPTSLSMREGFTWAAFSPQNNMTYYLGGINRPDSGIRNWKLSPCKGIIRSADFNLSVGDLPATAEASSVYLRINDATDVLVSDKVIVFGWFNPHENLNLYVDVNQGDRLEFKWITPQWQAPPQNVRIAHSIGIQCQ